MVFHFSITHTVRTDPRQRVLPPMDQKLRADLNPTRVWFRALLSFASSYKLNTRTLDDG